MANLVSMLAATVREHGQRPLFGTRSATGWSWLTYREFASLVDALRSGLASLGVTRGDRVAVISHNRMEWAVAYYATVGLGAAYVPMYEQQAERDWRHILGNCGAKVCFISGRKVGERVAALAPEIPTLQHVVDFDAPREEPRSYLALLDAGRRQPCATVPLEDRDIAEIIYTSGTTGTPKGVLLTHDNLVSNVRAGAAVVPVTAEDRSLAFLPWAHVFGGGELNVIISIGASTAICESVDDLPTELAEVRPTLLFAVPRVWNRVYQAVQQTLATQPRLIQRIVRRATGAMQRARAGERLSEKDSVAIAIAKALVFRKIRAHFGGRLRYAVSAAAVLSPEVAGFIDDLGIVVLEAYGLTETSGCATINRPGDRRIGTVGKPTPGVWIEIDRSASDRDDGSGEIVVHGHCVMAGYHAMPAETAKTLTPDGGLRTGDLGRIDADGFLHITGRLKELYKLENGKYVAPAQLEEQLTLSPFIDEALVHGANRPFNVALVVPSRQALTAWAQARGLPTEPYEALLRHPEVSALIEAEIARESAEFKGFERIAAFAFLAEPFSIEGGTMTPTLKVKRIRVLERHQKLLDDLYPSAAEPGGAVPTRPLPRRPPAPAQGGAMPPPTAR
jgi:long-chain acyl-CoA synthetase